MSNQEFEILNQVNDEVPIKVVRDGNFTTVPKKDLVVGDIVFLEIGEEVDCQVGTAHHPRDIVHQKRDMKIK